MLNFRSKITFSKPSPCLHTLLYGNILVSNKCNFKNISLKD